MNAISNLPTSAKLGIVAIALFSIWLLLADDKVQSQIQNQTSRTSDYAMTDFTMTVMDINGSPARVINGDEMAHYPDDESTEIINPVTEFIEPGQDTWIIESKHGHTQDESDTILLTGNVIITNKDNPSFQMLTEKLTLDTTLNTAYTDQHVTILSPQGDTESVGLHAGLSDETINLHSRVKGQYDAPAK